MVAEKRCVQPSSQQIDEKGARDKLQFRSICISFIKVIIRVG